MTLFANRVSVDIISCIRQGHAGLGWALNSMSDVLIRSPAVIHRHTHREHHVKMELAIRLLCLQAKECQEWPAPTNKLEEARKDSSLKSSEGAWPCRHLDFRQWAQKWERINLFF